MEEMKEKSSGRRRRWGGSLQHPARAEGDGLDLPVVSRGFKLLPVESKVDPPGVSCLDSDFLPASDGALAAGDQKFRCGRFAVDGD